MSLAYVCDSGSCTFIQKVEKIEPGVLPAGWTEIEVRKAGSTKSQLTKKSYQLCPSCSAKAERETRELLPP